RMYGSSFFQAAGGIRDFHVTGVQTCVFRSAGCGGIAFGLAAPAQAQESDEQAVGASDNSMETLYVTETAPTNASSSKFTAPLLEDRKSVCRDRAVDEGAEGVFKDKE